MCNIYSIKKFLVSDVSNSVIHKPNPVNNGEVTNLPNGPITCSILVSENKLGRYVTQALANIKSALLLSREPLRYFLFSNNIHGGPEIIKNIVATWPAHIQNRLTIEVVNVTVEHLSEYIDVIDEDVFGLDGEAKKIHYLLQLMYTMDVNNIHHVIAMDADTIFMSDISLTWNLFTKFNKTQYIGMGPGGGRYRNRSDIYGVRGLNSGVILLDLVKVRKVKDFAQHMIDQMIYEICPIGDDQCAMLTYFKRHAESMYYMPCSHNLHIGTDPCLNIKSREFCESIFHEGIYIYHGSGGFYRKHNESDYNMLLQSYTYYHFDKTKIEDTRYWRNVLYLLEEKRGVCGDASVTSFEYYLQLAGLIK